MGHNPDFGEPVLSHVTQIIMIMTMTLKEIVLSNNAFHSVYIFLKLMTEKVISTVLMKVFCPYTYYTINL